MDAELFYEGIQLDHQARLQLRQVEMDEHTYIQYKRSFYADEDAFIERVKRLDNHRQLVLYLFVRFAVDLYEQYKQKGITDGVYFHTFSDLQTWCMVCFRKYDEYGLIEYGWLKEHVQMRLFRLGRLQFQPITMDREVMLEDKKVRKGQQVLSVHIPAGGPLDPLEVEASFAWAEAFFEDIAPVFVCDSWLIYPDLLHVLNPNSNVLQFLRHFHVYHTDESSRDGESTIFGRISDDANDYPENTDMQRRIKAHLLSGKRLGSGSGIKFGVGVNKYTP